MNLRNSKQKHGRSLDTKKQKMLFTLIRHDISNGIPFALQTARKNIALPFLYLWPHTRYTKYVSKDIQGDTTKWWLQWELGRHWLGKVQNVTYYQELVNLLVGTTSSNWILKIQTDILWTRIVMCAQTVALIREDVFEILLASACKLLAVWRQLLQCTLLMWFNF